jgi:uncharacterized spore protein YtfJ
MNEQSQGWVMATARSQAEATAMLERMLQTADVKSVYSEPTQVGEYIVVTAAEVTAAGGFGFGSGGGLIANSAKAGPETVEDGGGGGGGGGGGTFTGRPVAVISIGPNGVQVEPIIDLTKIALALFTTIGAMVMLLGRMRRGS